MMIINIMTIMIMKCPAKGCSTCSIVEDSHCCKGVALTDARYATSFGSQLHSSSG